MGDKAEKKEKKPPRKKKTQEKARLLKVDQIIAGDTGNRYLVEGPLGEGGFGQVYKVSSLKEPEKKYAMKAEANDDPKHKNNMLRLKIEIHVFDVIWKDPAVDKTHFVKMYDKGKTATFKYYVMDLIRMPLKDCVMKLCNGVLSPHSAITVARQTLKGLETLHEVGFLHRDVKWHNFAIGLPPKDNIIYCLDFGIAKPYRETDGRVRIGRASVPFMGTMKYASIRSMSLLEQCRKDDLESWLYMMLEIYDRKNLSWMMYDFGKQSDMVLRTKKEVMNNSRIFVANGSLKIPAWYCSIIEKINAMSYADPGDYKGIYEIIGNAVRDERIDMDSPLDWIGKKLAEETKKDVTNKTKKDKLKKAKKFSRQTEDEQTMDDALNKRDKRRKKRSRAMTEDEDWRSDEDDSESDYSDEDEEEEERRRRRRKGRSKMTRERTRDYSDRDDRRRRRRSPGGGKRRDRDRDTRDDDGPRRRRRSKEKTMTTIDDLEDKTDKMKIPESVLEELAKEQKKKKEEKTAEVKKTEDKPPEKPSPSKEKVAEMLDDGAYMALGEANSKERLQDEKDKKEKEEKEKAGDGKTPGLTLLSLGRATPAAKVDGPEPVKKAKEEAKKEPAETKKK